MPLDAPVPREWAERKVNVVQFTEFPRGGHFSSWEVPELFADDLRAFVRRLRVLGRSSPGQRRVQAGAETAV